MRTLVVGLGNPVLRDDSVGWHVARRLRPLLADREGIEVEECCRGGLDLMERLVGYDRAIIVDAITTGAPPGTIHRTTPAAIPTRNSASSHDVTLPAALELGRRAGAELPADDAILLVGVEAADTATFSEQCTPAVQNAVPEAVELVAAELERKRMNPWP